MSFFSSSKFSPKQATEPVSKSPAVPSREAVEFSSESTPEVAQPTSLKPESIDVTVDSRGVQAEQHNCETAAHLLQYPVIKSAVGLIEDIPGVKTVADSTQQVSEFLNSQYLLKPVIKTIDGTGNAVLNTVDSVIPSLQTTDFETIGKTIQEPCIQANNAINSATTFVNDTVDSNIVAPSKNLVNNARDYCQKNIYDTQGKPLVRGAIDPLVKPYNTAIESFTQKFFPEGEEVPKDFKTEWDRKIQLELNLVKKVIPATANAATTVVMAPYNYSSHVVDVFQQNLKKDEKKSVVSSLQAVYLSKTELTSEIWDNTVGAGLQLVFGKKEEGEATTETPQENTESFEAPEVVESTEPAAESTEAPVSAEPSA